MKKSMKLFRDFGILTEREMEARHDIYLELYTKKIQIESRVIGDLALNHIVPVALRYQKMLVDNVRGMKEIFTGKEFQSTAGVQLEMIKTISAHVANITSHVEKMIDERKKANNLHHAKDQALAYCHKVKPYFDTIRYEVDKLELLIDDTYWTLPKYRELLFTK
jgi:glutamine synthetase